MAGGEVYFEFIQVGQQMRVSAIDADTGTEVVVGVRPPRRRGSGGPGTRWARTARQRVGARSWATGYPTAASANDRAIDGAAHAHVGSEDEADV